MYLQQDSGAACNEVVQDKTANILCDVLHEEAPVLDGVVGGNECGVIVVQDDLDSGSAHPSASEKNCHEFCFAGLGGEMVCLLDVDDNDATVLDPLETLSPLSNPVVCQPGRFNTNASFSEVLQLRDPVLEGVLGFSQ